MVRIKILSLLVITNILFISTISAQRKMEALDRGLHAIKQDSGVYLSWRILATEFNNVSFNLYRDGVKLNDEAISETSNYFDLTGLQSSNYCVKTIIDGVEQQTSKSVAPWENSYFDIPVKRRSTHDINDASVGDLDGDGDYEVIVKRLALDKSHEGTDYHILEAYHLDGTFIWEINLGPNIYNDKEFNFLVYDFDEDGKAEIAMRTSEGCVDGLGNEIGDMNGDGKTNYRYSITHKNTGLGFRSEGMDFISVFDGEIGEEIARNHYISLSPINQWGLPGMNIGQYSHRGTKCMWTVAYLDGKTPSMVMGRGIYEKIVLEAWQFQDNQLKRQWRFDTDSWPGYNKQGNHNLSLADVDSDGRDEIVYGSMVVDDDGKGLYTTKFGHGDALHVSDMDPDNPGLEVFQCLESSPYWGLSYREAENGNPIVHHVGGKDWGRCCAGDITAEYKGMEVWGGSGYTFWDCKGNVIGQSPNSVNFMIWWDGDLLREFLDHDWLGASVGAGTGTIRKYNGTTSLSPLLIADGTYSNNYTKGTPCISADILGDWREEVIWRSVDNTFMRIYTTPYYTENKMYTLMHDPQYRAAISWQNNSYNQPPHVGFYLGDGMDTIPIPNIKIEKTDEINNNLKSPWKHSNIGNFYSNPIIKQDNSDFEIETQGKSISDKYDNYNFVYQDILGDGEIITKLESLASDSSSASAGIMIRESNNTSSKYISINYSQGYGLTYQFRDANDKSASGIVIEDIELPVWLKIERIDDKFTMYTSETGDSWNRITKKTIDFDNNAMIGFYAVSGEKSNNCSALFNSVEIDGIQGGGLLMERWNEIDGTSIQELITNENYPENPDLYQIINTSETPVFNTGKDYGTRIRGYVVPEITGNYAFHISGKDSCKMFLSSDDSDENAMLIASVPVETSHKEWTKYPEQTSDSIYLEKGQKYYIEILHKADTDSNHVSAAWSGQGFDKNIIKGNNLSPYLVERDQQTAISDIKNSKADITIFPNPATSILNIQISLANDTQYNYRMYDITGNLIKENTLKKNSQIDISTLKRGVYIINISGSDFSSTKKIVIQ